MAEVADPIVRTVDIEAAPEAVFAYFVDAARLDRWLTVGATLDPRAGGVCVQHHAAADPERGPFAMQGTFLEVDPPRRVVFTWGFTDPEVGVPPGSTVVEVTLTPAGAGTRVTLVHRDLPAAAADEHAAGWTEMLGRLVRAVEESA